MRIEEMERIYVTDQRCPKCGALLTISLLRPPESYIDIFCGCFNCHRLTKGKITGVDSFDEVDKEYLTFEMRHLINTLNPVQGPPHFVKSLDELFGDDESE